MREGISLELVSMNDLITEILKRCDHGVIALLQMNRPTPGAATRFRRFHGDSCVCVGLAADIGFYMTKEQWKQEQEASNP